MSPADWIILGVLALILGGAGLYVYKARKRGQKCVGCPHAKTCGKCGCDAKKG